MPKNTEKSHINRMKTIDLLFSKPLKPHIVSTDRRMDGQKDGLTDRWMDGRMDRQTASDP